MITALDEAGLLAGSTPVRRFTGVHERCGTPAEFQVRPQWFVAVRENADRFRGRAAELDWIPEFMRRRIEDWIDGLKWDWNISRQRRYGVPFPVWFCGACGEPVLAAVADLPADPLADRPPVPACPSCGSADLAGDPDVMDTWMTSSMTPQINDGWAGDRGSDPALVPMSMRVQGFEIIRNVRTGRKLAVKLWNVGRFLSLNMGDFSVSRTPRAEPELVDRWMLSHLARAVTEATAAFEENEYAQAYLAVSRVFWAVFCDRYLEMIKDRMLSDSARWTLWEAYRVLLGLFAPFAPFVTEEMYQRFYRAHEQTVSLHLTAWPAADPSWVSDTTAVDQLAVILDATRVLRSQRGPRGCHGARRRRSPYRRRRDHGRHHRVTRPQVPAISRTLPDG